MSEMAERVALVICFRQPCACRNGAGFDGMPCLNRARAGILAMREPTDKMTYAAAQALWASYQQLGVADTMFSELHDDVRRPWVNSARLMLKAAVDEALK